jgi:exodeoxyribonuclease-3
MGKEIPMKIISWNVNGIRSAQKKGLLEFYHRERPEIFCIQETKAHKEQLDALLITPDEGVHSYWSSATTRKGYSGVATYCREEPISVEYGIGEKRFDAEGRFVITKHKDFTLYNVYFPNGGAREERHLFKQDFLKVFREHLEEKIKAGEKIILVGDYNIAHREVDIYDPVRLSTASGFLPEERQWFDQFLQTGFVDTFRAKNPEAKDRYSWWSYRELARVGNRGWRIDYICVSENLAAAVQDAEILDAQEGSDHCPVLINLV